MSDSFLEKVLPKLGILCFEYHSEGYFSCLGESPPWAMEIFPCVRNRFPQILPCDISPFLENFLVDAKEFWQQDSSAVMRSGYWTESVQTSQKTPQLQGSEVHIEALVLTLESRFLLLLEVSEVKFFETFNWLQTARKDRLDSMVELKESASQMMSASLFDALTGLPNKQAFYIQISQWLERLRRDSTQTFVLIKLESNDVQRNQAVLGQDWGDQYLRQFTQRLKRYCQDHDVVARLGVETFGLLIHQTDQISQDTFIQQLITGLRSPYQIKSRIIYTTSSIGALKIDTADQSVEACIENVSLALKQAQSKGRDQYCMYDEALRDRHINDLTLEQQFLSAIENRTLVTEYRPLFSRQANQFIGLEILLEWPQSAQYSAENLRAIAQSMGLGTRLATYEIEKCFPLLNDYRSPLPMTMIIHSSPQALFDPQYIQVLTRLKTIGQESDTIILKLSHISMFMTLDKLNAPLQTLKALNIKLCMSLKDLDGLSQLKHWFQHIQFISIDPSRQNLDIASTKMLHPELRHWKSGSLQLLAEQVNRQSHDPIIADLGIDLCCGDFFSDPVPLDQLLSLLQA